MFGLLRTLKKNVGLRSPSRWKVTGVSVKGPSHEMLDLPCQDHHSYRADDRKLVAVVCDGAGSRRHSDFGAKYLSCKLVDALSEVDTNLCDASNNVSDFWQKEIKSVIQNVRSSIVTDYLSQHGVEPDANISQPIHDSSRKDNTEEKSGDVASITSGYEVDGKLIGTEDTAPHQNSEMSGNGVVADETEPTITESFSIATNTETKFVNDTEGPADRSPTLDDFAATMVGVIAQPEGGFFFHIGDGCAVACHDLEDWGNCTVSDPENGEYANETFFFTGGDWDSSHLRFKAFPPAAMILLMSDGSMPFTMAKGKTSLALGFIPELTSYFREHSEEQGKDVLGEVIGGEQARSISSDDKSLVWALRK
ncbi:MAG: protein phosphatase 2C domain-containing protein [Candidatus Poribacteria bacterium]|jgi:hypothetical protein|nr:protein phosphatase 2C domain-containing protein [Candidatus Poribacteria bacterium]